MGSPSWLLLVEIVFLSLMGSLVPAGITRSLLEGCGAGANAGFDDELSCATATPASKTKIVRTRMRSSWYPTRMTGNRQQKKYDAPTISESFVWPVNSFS